MSELENAAIAIATANEQMVLQIKNFNGEVEISCEPKLDVSDGLTSNGIVRIN